MRTGAVVKAAIVAAGSLFAFTMVASAQPLALNALDADEKAWFYNRAGVSISELEFDLGRCAQFTRQASRDDAERNSGGVNNGLLNSILTAGHSNVYVDTCMVSLGYRRFDIVGEPMRSFLRRRDTMSDDQRLALASAEMPPEGALSRVWDNSAWLARDGDSAITLRPRSVAPTSTIAIQNTVTAMQRAPNGVPSGQALVVLLLVRIVEGGAGAHQDQVGLTNVRFARITGSGVDSAFSASVRSRRSAFSVEDVVLAATEFYALVPPGTYYLQSVWAGLPVQTVEFCMGAPAFDVAAGEIVHLGQFTLRPGGARVSGGARLNMGPPNIRVRLDSTDLDAARARLGAFGGRLVAAQWRNGQAAPCMSGLPIYGLTLPGVN